ncbi:TonB-dependent receptor [Pararhizobium sp.]|uniref:TonB-dependent receptor n=1 Tax=Pararhizobium sp. TaxID=1977563 RepID=UPI0027184C16|nr:TonB-dependent receptor [Pararhizobium sp.]MDO9418128.1 TonB-dependent receptor [Pararhizobium sp.]
MSSPTRRAGRFQTNRNRRMSVARLLATTAVAGFWSLSPMAIQPAAAQAKTSRVIAARTFDIPAQPLDAALNAFGRQSGLQVTLAAETSEGVRSNAVSGSLTPQQALDQLLAGTGISHRLTADGTAVISSPQVSNMSVGAINPDGTTVLQTITTRGSGKAIGQGDVGEINITAKDLERKNPQNIADVFRGEAGIQVGSSLPMSQKVYVHGVEETNLAVTIDGSRQNNKVFHHNATTLIDPGLLKAVSVDAGVATADAGPGALAGSIVYETKDVGDLLEGDGIGGFVTSSYNTNSKTFTNGVSVYGKQDGLEALGYLNFGRGDEFKAGNGQIVGGTSTDILSGLGKVAYEFDSGDRFELSHEQLHDAAPRPFRANAGYVFVARRPWEPRIRDYTMDRMNTVFTYTDATPEGWWDPTLVLAHSRTRVATPFYVAPVLPSTVPAIDYEAIGVTESLNGKFENKFSFDIGNIIAGLDFYSDRTALEASTDSSKERNRNIGAYVQARLEPWERTRLSFGLRGDRQSFIGTGGQKFNNSGLSSNISGEYDLIENFLTAKAGYSHVWAGIPLAETFNMNPKWTYAGGAEPTSADNRTVGLLAKYEGFSVEGTLFQTDIYSARVAKFGPALALSASRVETEGYEIGVGYDWIDGFFKVKYANIDVKIDGKPADSDVGTYLATPAGELVTLTAGHTFTDWGLTVGGDVEFALDYDKVSTGSKPFEGYQVANIFLEYKPVTHQNLTFRAEVNNIFDKTYSDRASYGQEFGNVTPLYESGRSFMLTAKATF